MTVFKVILSVFKTVPGSEFNVLLEKSMNPGQICQKKFKILAKQGWQGLQKSLGQEFSRNCRQYSTVQYNTIQYNTIQYSTVQHSIQSPDTWSSGQLFMYMSSLRRQAGGVKEEEEEEEEKLCVCWLRPLRRGPSKKRALGANVGNAASPY